MTESLENKLKQQCDIPPPEVLAPAGDMERFYAAVKYGADAVYLGGTKFGMRASSSKFDWESLKTAVDYAHKNGVKVYLTCNTLPNNTEIAEFPEYIQMADACGIDAAIASDIGVLSLIKKYAPNLDIHISTQAGIVNYVTANAFYEMGAKRVVLARELSFEEIAEIRQKTPKDLEIEAFVHGAMCMSFSGRCLISNYLVGRDANRGECAQPCRWAYHLVQVDRPNQYFPISQEENGTYILNAKDLCMIEYIDKLIECGITSLKIEGRAKSAYYVAVITNAYRMAVDEYLKNPKNFKLPQWLLEETKKVSHRQYSTGFFFGKPHQSEYYENGGYIRSFDVCAVVDESDGEYVTVTTRNKFVKDDVLEVFQPGEKPFEIKVDYMEDENNTEVVSACHPMMTVKIKCNKILPQGTILRKLRDE